MSRTVPLLALAALLAFGVPDARAQSERSLVIRDGRVYVDGREQTVEALPQGLALDGVAMELTFSAGAEPVFELGGRVYAVVGEALVAMPYGGRWAAPVGGDARRALQTVLAEQEATAQALQQRLEDVEIEEFEAEADEGLERAAGVRGRAMENARRRLEDEQLDHIAAQLRQQAAQARMALDHMERAEAVNYLEDVRARDRELYGRLVREWELEAETVELVRRARQSPSAGLTDSLRARLDAIFELKQDNRRDEIRELEAQLEAMRQRLREREAQRTAIIERRLVELVEGGQAP